MKSIKIAIIGLGYVGLPLARLFATKYPVVGFDINVPRVAELMDGVDSTFEVTSNSLQEVLVKQKSDLKEIGLFCTTELNDIRDCNYYIITVPTPVDRNNSPDLQPLISASKTVGKVLSKNDIVIYESTVYPGATEEDCIPVIEKISNLKYNVDFFAGYSPERINPGDKCHTVDKIKKITSGSTYEVGQLVNDLYASVITAGTHLAPNIKVAEAAKVIENAQRDINIAFVNELAKIFNLMDINTIDVLEAASTKWNFLPFKPGFVGGHCIGVDPYYLAQKAQQFGYHPEIILAGRRINDGMAKHVAIEVVKLMIRNNIKINNANVLILGVTFKENCPDIRNTKIVDLYNELEKMGINIDVFDPLANKEDVLNEYNIKLLDIEGLREQYSCIIHAVAHKAFNDFNFNKYRCNGTLVYDVKGVLESSIVDMYL